MKKLFSLILATLVLVTCCPLSVFAETNDKNRDIVRYSVLILDASGSMYGTPCSVQRAAANSFCNTVINAEGENHVAIVRITTESLLACDFTNDETVLQDTVNGTYADSGTNIYNALEIADELLDGVTAEPGETLIKNIVLCSDGLPENGPYSYSGRYTYSDQSYSYCYANSAYDLASEIKLDGTYIYALGFFHSLTGNNLAFGRRFMSDIQNAGYYEVTETEDLEFVFGEIADDLIEVHGNFKYAGQIEQSKDSESDYWYSDSYFYKDASDYNPSLATMSLCFELSTWSSHEMSSWYNPSYKENNVKFWQDKLVNVKTLLLGDPNGKDGYEGLEFTDFKANSFWQAAPTKDSIGVCAARKQITDRSDKEDYTLIAVAVRGGGYGSEWASNFTLGESGEHQGFAEARDNVLEFLDDYVAGLRSDESKKLKIWIVGFSRAGATANMTAGALNTYHSLPGVTLDQEDTYCYTFEAPQGAVRSTLSANHENIHNVRNLNDLVPLVAPYSWNFARYNYQNDITLPSKYTDSHNTFDVQYEAMKAEFNRLGFSTSDDTELSFFDVEEYCDAQELRIDKSKFLPWGDPLWWWVDTREDTNSVLVNGINFLADDVFDSREYYNENLEYCIRQLLGILMHYDGAKAGLSDYAGEVLDVQAFFENLEELFTFENIVYILSPMFSINPFYSYDERVEDVKLRLMEKMGGIFREYAEIDGFLEAIGDILVDLILQVAYEVWNNNTDSINTVIKTVKVLADDGFNAHFPELCLAWCRSLDPNYNSALVKNSDSTVTRIIRINCPVDVDVYDSEGNIVASIKDNICDENIDDIIYFVNSNEEKLLYLPGDEDYNITITATDNGEVSYSVGEFDYTYYDYTRLENYYDITVNTGDIITAEVPAIIDEELVSNPTNGSSADYSVAYNGSDVSCDEEYSGDAIDSLYFDVTVTSEGNSGYVSGAGQQISGSFAKVEAYLLPGGEFEGWYIDNELVSTDMEYRFAVKKDTDVVAKFSDVEFNEFNVKAGRGGSVTAAAGYYPEGINLGVSAEAKFGYEFESWSVSGGSIEDRYSAETSFTMPSGNAVVTANFKELFSLGDIDENGAFDAIDASTILKEYANKATGKDAILTPMQYLAADINYDDSVDASDASSVLAYYAFTSSGGELSIKDFLNK